MRARAWPAVSGGVDKCVREWLVLCGVVGNVCLQPVWS